MRSGCPGLYDWSAAVHRFQPDIVSDFYHYFICLGVFGGFWASVTGSGLRMYSDLSFGPSEDKVRLQFHEFFLWSFLGWAVQYRVSQWVGLPSYHANQEWVTWAALNFLFVTVSSFWVLPVMARMWNKNPPSWRAAIWQVYWRSWLIYVLTVLTFFWLVVYAALPIVPALLTLNVLGLVWSFVVGTRRWRMLQTKQDPTNATLGTHVASEQ